MASFPDGHPSLPGKLTAGYVQVGVVNTSVLLAVSGGADSMALLTASARLADGLNLRLEVACVDHGLRSESAAEQARVGQRAEALGLPFHAPRLTGLQAGASLEARAREARYAALEEVARSRSLRWIATAHTGTDQAETLLMRLARGSALGGAAGVLPVRGDRIVRPMLACTRAEVLAYLRALGIEWTDDPMNRDPQFTRVRVRREVMPAIRSALGDGAESALARFAAHAGEDAALLEELAQSALRRVRLPASSAEVLDAVAMRALARPLRRRIWARLLEARALPVDAAVIERMEGALAAGTTATLPRGHLLRCAGGLVRLVEPEPAPPARPESEAVWRLQRQGGALQLPDGTRLRWGREDEPGALVQPLLCPPSLDVLEVRRRRASDRVQTASGRTRKLQDLLVDLRVPREERDGVWLLAEPGTSRIFCAVGLWPLQGPGHGGYLVIERA